jgi:hypothetical protein
MPDPRRSRRILHLPPAHGGKGGGKTGLERAGVGATVGGRGSLGLSGHAASCPSPSWHRWLGCKARYRVPCVPTEGGRRPLWRRYGGVGFAVAGGLHAQAIRIRAWLLCSRVQLRMLGRWPRPCPHAPPFTGR